MPMPPFHNRSTGAFRIAEMSWFGVKELACAPIASRASSLIVIDFSVRANTPPPSEIRSRS